MHEIQWRFAPSLVEDALKQILPDNLAPDSLAGHARLRQAMHYAVFSGGKRLRSQLVLEAAGVVSADFDALRALSAACSLEIIHAYSLVHDDLPSMDNADTR
ncbi:MAG: polyprenyl synthetase family protein, partial [Abitibacteriaceae bacterium]|nr:polyprenyl synthetase family protein [Abditibacteriaceae bacterium]